MKSIILAGGTGSRLEPLTSVVNKHLLPIDDKPAIMHVYELAQRLDDNPVIVTNPSDVHAFAAVLPNAIYCVQGIAKGTADALRYAEPACKDRNVAVFLADNLLWNGAEHQLIDDMRHLDGGVQAAVWQIAVPDVRHFGVAKVKEHKLLSIEEKPNYETATAGKACIGVYYLPKEFWSWLKFMQANPLRMEYEISDVVNRFAESDAAICKEINGGDWADFGVSIEEYHRCNRIFRTNE